MNGLALSVTLRVPALSKGELLAEKGKPVYK